MQTRIYDLINPLFGTPAAVTAGNYQRTDNIFREKTTPFLESVREHLGGRVLVVGCGKGQEVGWIARHCESVVGIDIREASLSVARATLGDLPNVELLKVDDRLPFGTEFDTVFMHDVCEHIMDLGHWFAEYHRVLKPGGVLINQFAPLFYSPYGAHLQDALKVPWGHLLFGLRTVVEVRNRYYPNPVAARTWGDLGLNRVTEDRYRRIVRESGFVDLFYEKNTSKGLPFGNVPILKNLFIVQITNLLRKPD